MLDTAKRRVLEALEARGDQTSQVAIDVAQGLDEELCEQIVLEYVLAAQRVILRRPHAADPRQGWLAMPEWKHVPTEVAGESLEELRARITRLEKKLRLYDYARRSPEKLKADKAQLRELRRIEAKAAPLFAGAPALDVNGAMKALQARGETPRAARNRKGGKARQGLNEKSIT